MAFTIETILLTDGARLGISPLPGRYGDGLADLAAAARWGASLVISMTEMLEMERHNMGDFGALLAQADIGWAHFPIPDYGAPKAALNWPALRAEAHGLLDQGDAVLAHCYGGRGRSGMVLLRLMAERGEDPQEAVARLRTVRPGAVESEAQFAWGAEGADNLWKR